MGVYSRVMGLFFVLVFLFTPLVCVPLAVLQYLLSYVQVQVFYVRYSVLLDTYIEKAGSKVTEISAGKTVNLTAIMKELNATIAELLRLASSNTSVVCMPTLIDRAVVYVVAVYIMYPWLIFVVVPLLFVLSFLVVVRPSKSYEELMVRANRI